MSIEKQKHRTFEKPDQLSSNAKARNTEQPKGEVGGNGKPEPTRFGDWESGGRCTDF